MRFPCLFITYDGLLDQLGRSQILPYLFSITSHTGPIYVLSFEKHDRMTHEGQELRAQLEAFGIHWTPLPHSPKRGILEKAWELLLMHLAALLLFLRHKFKIVHCRSYQSMQVGTMLSRLFDVKLIFDMRGLWVDDRVDGGLWPQDVAFYRILYQRYKRLERRMLESADHIVVLTQAVVPIIRNLAPRMNAQISVIPCCADFDHFRFSYPSRNSFRSSLNIPSDSLVISYLGSLGTVYLLRDMLKLFKSLSARRTQVDFLLITNDWSDKFEDLISELGITHLRSHIHICPASRATVPQLMSCSDIMLSFRLATFSQAGCSPTKLAEAYSLGIPVISNIGVGDVEEISNDLDGGICVDLSDPHFCDIVLDNLDLLLSKGGDRLRNAARGRLGLEVASSSYRKIYSDLKQSILIGSK